MKAKEILLLLMLVANGLWAKNNAAFDSIPKSGNVQIVIEGSDRLAKFLIEKGKFAISEKVFIEIVVDTFGNPKDIEIRGNFNPQSIKEDLKRVVQTLKFAPAPPIGSGQIKYLMPIVFKKEEE